MTKATTLAVITGQHSFDVPNFYRLFRSLEGIDAYVQHLEHFTSSPESTRDAYNAVLFYNMHLETPDDTGPWFVGKTKSAILRLLGQGQGITVLHHGLLAFREWDLWNEVTGIADRSFDYKPGVELKVTVLDSQHEITAGLADWKMVDETYKMCEPQESQPLLTTDHPTSMKHLAWMRQCRGSRIFCFASGHDQLTWGNNSFQQVLRRGILWSAGEAS